MRTIFALVFFLLCGCAALTGTGHRHSAHKADAANPQQSGRWFAGWGAINGGGPHARATNDDWHMQNGLRLSVGGTRVPLLWRDGAASGYSLELKQVNYPERKLSVLQLNVIEDASGKPLTYVWADDKADSIGLNLGWLQVGLQLEAVPPPSNKPKP